MADTDTPLPEEVAVSLLTHLRKAFSNAAFGPIVNNEQISDEKLHKPRMRAQALFEGLIIEGLAAHPVDDATLTEMEIKRCAVVIAAAFLNPLRVPWDYDRFADSERKRRSDQFFPKASVGKITRPATIVDVHGRILVWYLPSLLLPSRVTQLNKSVLLLRRPLSCRKADKSWRSQGFLEPPHSILGSGKLSISVGTFMVGHKRLQDPIVPSSILRDSAVQEWLKSVQPVEHLLNAVLQVVHPELWDVITLASQQLANRLPFSIPCWPTAFTGVDLIVNRVTEPHIDSGGATTFYDHLLSLGMDHQATLQLDDLEAELAYSEGTSVLLAGRVLMHSVPAWAGGERIVLAHYAKDDVLHRLGCIRPLLPTQMAWWKSNGSGL